MSYLAHTAPSPSGKPEPLEAHLQDVAERARRFARAFEAADEAWIAGLLHDFGKFGDLFQRRLQGKERRIDHWSSGAWLALQTYRTQGVATALAVQGHHIGPQQASKDSLSLLNPARLTQGHPLGLRISSPDIDALVERFKDSGLALPDSRAGACIETPYSHH
jgi:CRISPR-associated endonuclease/helicase Cas3